VKKLIFDFMRNIGVSQLIVVFFIGILLFSDFSKIIKNIRGLIGEKKVYKNMKKK